MRCRPLSALLTLSLTSAAALTLGNGPEGKALAAAAAAPATATVTPAHPFVTTKLANGLELVAVESHKVPLVTIVLTFKAGAMTETRDINGLTHLWEHMFFKGNQRIPNQEAFNKRIRQLGISFNGDTAAEKVRYFFTLPSVFLDEGLQFMADAIKSPLLEQTELEKERRVVLDEYDRAAAHPGFDFNNLQRVMMYGAEEYRRDPLGLRPTIIGATRDQLYRIKREVFVPLNGALIVGGDFKPAELTALVKKHFGDWESGKDWQPVKQPAFPPFTQSTDFVMTRPNVENATVELEYAGPLARTMPKDTFAVDVLINLLGLKNGKFYRKFVDSGLAYRAGLGYYTESRAGEIDLSAQTAPEKAQEVAKLLEAEVKLWAEPGYFSESELADVRRSLLINHKRELNQPSEFTKSLAFWWAVTGLDYYTSYIPNLQKTSLADVQAFVKKWLLGKPRLKGILVSPDDAKKAGLTDSAGPLVDKYLGMYRDKAAPAQPAPQKG